MAFFKKFAPVKIPARKKLDFHTDRVNCFTNSDKIQIALGPTEYSFHKGEWIPSSRQDHNHGSYEILQQHYQDLKEENNFFRLKIDILLDMVTNVSAENQMKEREINQLRLELYSNRHKR